jgi:hypothetical protein
VSLEGYSGLLGFRRVRVAIQVGKIPTSSDQIEI